MAMSRARMERRHQQLTRKRTLSRREQVTLDVLDAVLHNDGLITTGKEWTARRGGGWWR